MNRKTFGTVFGVGAAAVAAGVLTLGGVASAATVQVSTLDPTPNAGTGWYKDDVRNTYVAEIASDYGAPSGLGSSALLLDTPQSIDKAQVFHNVGGTPLADVSAIAYQVYRSSESTAPGFQAPALNLKVDKNGGELLPGDYTTLVYEPVYNGYPSSGPAFPVDTWTPIDALAGGTGVWWSTNPIGAAPNRDTFPTWDALIAANPGATVLAIGVNQGSGNGGLFSAVDGYTFNGDTYDFETFVPTKDDCKSNGWATKWAPGTWKNQGACVSYFAKLD